MTQAVLAHKEAHQPKGKEHAPRAWLYAHQGHSLSADGHGLLDWLMMADRARMNADAAPEGVLARQWLPLWARLVGERSTQHINHHFPLGEHVLNVIENTRACSGFAALSQGQRHVAVLAALLHDIDKNTGPARFRHAVPVDRIHPAKSAELSMPELDRLGVDMALRHRLYSLIVHHQQFGALFARYPGKPPVDEVAMGHIAKKIRSPGLLSCLAVLSEGDIRSVQHAPGYFTEDVRQLLPQYLARTRALAMAWQQGRAWLPTRFTSADGHLAAFSGFVWPAESMAALLEALAESTYGGAFLLPYCQNLPNLAKRMSGQASGVVGLVGFLPENLAGLVASGDRPVWTPRAVPMQQFYDQYSGQAVSSDSGVLLSDGKESVFDQGEGETDHLQFDLQRDLQRDEAAFEGVAALMACGPTAGALERLEKFGAAACGLATRPILLAVAHGRHHGLQHGHQSGPIDAKGLEIPLLAL
ncbi:MAG: hypothetical protein KC476_00110 [Cyanobacteria bacterium HKST-UBA06]|nr:hypothetical protein [Cyanobacteria bacterium HKST-UBA06]